MHIRKRLRVPTLLAAASAAMPMRASLLVPLFLSSIPGIFPAALPAQAPAERAAFVVRLGNDTIAVERFTRTRTQLRGERVIRVPRTSVTRYSATLGGDGTITRFEASSHAGSQPDAPARQSSTVVFGADSATVTLTMSDSTRRDSTRRDSTRTYRVATRPAAVPVLTFIFALYEQMVRQMVASGQDSLALDLVLPGVLNSFPTVVHRVGADSATIGFFGAPLDVRIDATGRILGVSGDRTTQKVTVTRIGGADISALARVFAARDSGGGPLSPRDTARASIGGATLVVDYGRPRRRGRVIFGEVVPWGQVWRTGANAATGFTTDQDLRVGGVAVPAGSYTLFTLPTETGTSLIISSQTGQWGTDYNAAEDFARVALEQAKLEGPVEQFTIEMEATGADTGVLRLSWGRTEWKVGIEVGVPAADR